MKILLVTPVTDGSGETVTARYLAQALMHRGHEVLFLASPFATRFLAAVFPGRIRELGADGSSNFGLWVRTMDEVRPDAVVFADYPLLSMPEGVAPLVGEPGWDDDLGGRRTCLITLDHFGFAQREMGLFFGPPHLSTFYHRFPPIPARMRIMLPCPMHEPRGVTGRRGEPFRYWDVPLGVPDGTRAGTRERYLGGRGGVLVLHTVSTWAWKAAEMMRLPLYDHLPALLDIYLGALGEPVTVVSVNNGSLLEHDPAGIRIVNLPPVDPGHFDELLFSSDLLITENRFSISMGKAVCGLTPAGVLRNTHGLLDLMQTSDEAVRALVVTMEMTRPGSVYPFDVFPSGMTDMLPQLILARDNSLMNGFVDIELFGGSPSESTFRDLLQDSPASRRLAEGQREYIHRLMRLEDGAVVLERIIADGGHGP